MFADFRIPAFTGMTEGREWEMGFVDCDSGLISGAAKLFVDFWIPAFAGMTGGWK